MPRELSSTAKAIFDEMDSLFEDQSLTLNCDIMVTPPRPSKKMKDFMNSPDLSLVTYCTAESTVTKNISHDHDVPSPPGMVINAADQQYNYSKEAILDPTWLDSDEEEEDPENFDNNESFLSLNGSVLSAYHSEFAKSRSHSFGSSISVNSCGFGKHSLSDGSISSVGSKPCNEHILLDVIDVGKVYKKDWIGRTSVSDNSGGDILEHLYDIDNELVSTDDECSDSYNSCSTVSEVNLGIKKQEGADLPDHEEKTIGNSMEEKGNNEIITRVISDPLDANSNKEEDRFRTSFLIHDTTSDKPFILNYEPILLMGSSVGLKRGDFVLSLFDCLGSKTRRKRANRNKQNDFKWGHFVVQRCLKYSRKMNRMINFLSGEQLTFLSLHSKCRFGGLRCQNSPDVFSVEEKYASTTESCDDQLLSFLNNDEFAKAIQWYTKNTDNRNESDEDVHGDAIILRNLNFGLIYLLDSDYERSVSILSKLFSKVKEQYEPCLDVLTLLGCAYYGLDDFQSAESTFRDAVTILKKRQSPEKDIILSQMYNNIGCCLFEMSSESNALKYMRKSFLLQKKHTSQNYENIKSVSAATILRLVSIRGNLGYLHLRMKNNLCAISEFEMCLNDEYMILEPNDELIISTLDHLAIALLRAGKSDEAIQIYSKILTSKIHTHSDDHSECGTLLKKLSLLQICGKHQKSVRNRVVTAIYKNIDGNQVEYERFEKFLKSI